MARASLSNEYSLKASIGGRRLLSAPVSEFHAKWLGLMGIIGPPFLRDYPNNAAIFASYVAQIVEAALQNSPRAHRIWLHAVKTAVTPVVVQVNGLAAPPGSSGADEYSGGGGGTGGWPGGGGGGGGHGARRGGPGGDGGAGAMIALWLDESKKMVGVDPFLRGTRSIIAPTALAYYFTSAGGGGGAGGLRTQE